MLVKTYTRGLQTPETWADHVDSKIRISLGLFTHKIRRVDVFLSDINGPKGGLDMLCKIKTSVYGQAPFIVQEKADTVHEAINVCLHRTKRSISRHIERQIKHR